MSCEADNFTESSDDHDDFIKCDQLELTERAVYILVMFLFSVAAVPIVSLDMANSTFIQVNEINLFTNEHAKLPLKLRNLYFEPLFATSLQDL